MITAAQCRAARGLIAWSQQDLAQRAGIGTVAVHQLENGTSSPRRATLDVVRRAFEAAGVEFIPDGVRRRHLRTPEEKEALRRDIMAIAHRVAALSAENPGFSEEDLYDESGLPA